MAASATWSVNEKSAAWLNLSFFDNNNLPTIPTAIRYRVDCLSSGTAVSDWEDVAPNTSVSIKIASELNVIFDPTYTTETRRITVEASHGVGDLQTEEFDYNVVNLRKYP